MPYRHALSVVLFLGNLVSTWSVWAYEDTTVLDGGILTGAVKLDGHVPKPKGYNLTTLPDPFYCGRISDGQGWRILQPFNVGPAGEFREVVVYLEGIDKGKPFDERGVPQIEARDCLFLPSRPLCGTINQSRWSTWIRSCTTSKPMRHHSWVRASSSTSRSR